MPTPTLPLVRGGVAQALYPFVKRISFDTGITFMADGTEQRWKRRAPLFEFEWQYNSLLKADATALVSFFNARAGQFASDWSFTLGSQTFANLTMLSDAIEVIQSGPAEYNVKLAARQTQNRGMTLPSAPGLWPTFSTGAIVQYPYAVGYRNLTTVGDAPTGKRYTYRWWGGGLLGAMPSGPLRRFPITLTLPDDDAAIFETFVLGAAGKLNTWSFNDTFEGLAYYKMRLDTDVIEMHYEDVNQVRVSVPIIEIN